MKLLDTSFASLGNRETNKSILQSMLGADLFIVILVWLVNFYLLDYCPFPLATPISEANHKVGQQN